MAPSVRNDPASASSNNSLSSSHVDETALRPFLRPSFDHVDHLNSILPALSVSSVSQPTKQRNGISLVELTAHTQTTLSQLSASTSRLSDTLNTLTDDIIRTGSRLAYEVEILRGDTMSLSEAFDEGLVDEIKRFMPQGAEGDDANHVISGDVDGRKTGDGASELRNGNPALKDTTGDTYPPELDRLRTLAVVKDRLESVVKVFGEAMEWTLPPSELSITSSFISVSGPDSGPDAQGLEEKGQAMSKKLRDEIAVLLTSSPGQQGVDAARQRVEELRELGKVWKGTAEEKARIKFVEGLAKIVNERERLL